MQNIKRSNNNEQILVLINNEEKLVDKDKIYNELQVDGIIRIKAKYFDDIPGDYFGHFNLQHTSHMSGKKYGLVKILRHGYFKQNPDGSYEEQLPLLDLLSCKKGECIHTEHNVNYENLNDNYFAHSIKHIKSVQELQEFIVEMYGQSLPNLNKQELLDLGVGFTLLKIY